MNQTESSTQNLHDARAAGLRYIASLDTGIRRVPRKSGFAYIGKTGKPIRDKADLKRINSLVIPPAWRDVIISSDPQGHIQAVGRDDRGRKQYKYHPRWREIRDENKYSKLIDFAHALPKIRRCVRRDLKLRGLPRAKVLATVVKLLDCSLIRVGNKEYARSNHSFGLTTLRNRHVHVNGNAIHLQFRGKSGIEHVVEVEDPRLARIVLTCQHLPGQELFQYVDADGLRHAIDSSDVNAYLQNVAGDEFTAKDFRTWNGTVLAVHALNDMSPFRSFRQAQANIVTAVRSVATQLRNTERICRKCYIHPIILSAYCDGTLPSTQLSHSPTTGLRPDEMTVLALLKQRID